MTTIKERVIQLIEYKKIKKGDFFSHLNMSSSNFRGNASKTPLNSTAIVNIMTMIPDVNLEWLLTGRGEMLKNPAVKTENIPVISNSFTGLTDDQIEKMIEEAVTNKLLGMYESGVIYSAAAVTDLQRQIAELMLENAKLKADATPATKSGIAPQKGKE